jgi:flagellar biosynthesis anti-sigma factor FlgM
MRIDLNPSSMPELARSNGTAGAAQAGQPAVTDQAGATATDTTDDLANLSTGSESVQRLKVQLDAVPDVRQQLVDRLRQAVAEGSFTASPQHIAKAMLEGAGQTAGSNA